MKVTRFQDEDYPQLLPLFEEVYPANPLLRERAYFDWQFRDHPLNEDGRYGLWLLREGGKVEGFYGSVPVEVVLDGVVRKGCEPTIWWSGRRSGIGGLKLFHEVVQGQPVRLFHACTEDSIALFSRLGMPLFPLPRWMAVLDVDRTADLFGIAATEFRHRRLEDRERQERERGLPGNVIALERFRDEDEMCFDGWETIGAHLRYTGPYLNWRYFDIPDHAYRAVTTAQRREFAVYRIERIMGTDCAAMRIVDWTFRGERARDAIAFLGREAEAERVILMDFFCSCLEVGEELAGLGFVSTRLHPYDRIPRLFRPVHPAGDLVTCIDVEGHRRGDGFSASAWYVTKGNGDMDRLKRRGGSEAEEAGEKVQ